MEQRDNSGFDPAGDADDFSGDGDQVTEEGLTPPAAANAVADLERRLREQQEKYLRMAAEYENYRKRTTKERSEAFGRGQADLVKQLLDPLDDLARFAHVDPSTVDASTVVQGAEMV